MPSLVAGKKNHTPIANIPLLLGGMSANGRNDLADRSRGSRDSRIRSADKREIGRRHSRQAAIIEHGGRRPCPATFILDNIFYR
jgi:hypothetical protein